jgi:hypothetical protein
VKNRAGLERYWQVAPAVYPENIDVLVGYGPFEVLDADQVADTSLVDCTTGSSARLSLRPRVPILPAGAPKLTADTFLRRAL